MRRLSWLLALVMVPVLIMSGQTAASAVYGDVVHWSVSDNDAEGFNLRGAIECNGATSYVASSFNLSIIGDLVCDIDLPYAGDPGPGDVEDWDWSFSFHGTQPTADVCDMNASGSGDLLDGVEILTTPAGVTNCEVHEVCWHVDAHDSRTALPDNDWYWEGCSPLDHGDIPVEGAPSGACPTGRPVSVSYAATDLGEFNSNHDHNVRYTVTVTWSGSASEFDNWYIYPGKGTPNQSTTGGGTASTSGWWSAGPLAQDATQAFIPGSPTTWAHTVAVSEADLAAALANGPTHVQVYSDVNPPQANSVWSAIGYDLEAAEWATGPSPGPALTDVDGPSYRGLTQPEYCRFYFGPKLLDMAGDTDVPVSDLNVTNPDPDAEPDTEPDGFEDECEFNVLDPGTYLCGILEVLKGIWGTLENILASLGGLAAAIASAIVGAISDAFMALCVPSEGFFEDALNELKDAWAETPPIAFLDGLGDVGDALTISNPGGCAGPTLNVSTEVVGGGAVALQPLDACSEPVATVASLIKTALTVGVYVGGFLAAVRIISSALGFDGGIGGRGDGE